MSKPQKSSALTVAASEPKSAEQPATVPLEIIPASTKAPAPTAPPVLNDALMGAQLTEQYHRATSGQVEVVKFGAMMLRLRDQILRLHDGAARGNEERKGKGLKAWLKKHAPDVKEATAYRFMHVAEAVQQAFELPAKVSFLQLACSTAEELNDTKLAKKQEKLFAFVSGTSQKSWLDRFAPKVEKGGAKAKKEKPLTPEEMEALLNEEAQSIFKGLTVGVLQAQNEHRDLLLRLPAIATDHEKEIGLAQFRDHLKALLGLVEDTLDARSRIARAA